MSRLPILMYHAVSDNLRHSKGLTIAKSKLEEQFKYLVSKGYESLHFADLVNFKSKKDFPKKAVIITFDDVYTNQMEYAYPLLNKYNLKACFYVPFAYIGKWDKWNSGNEEIMSVDQLKQLDPKVIELGLHSFEHKNYCDLSLQEIKDDFNKCRNFISNHNINVHNTLAYPFGKFPKKQPKKTEFFNELRNQKIAYGLRIGNRVNNFPFSNNYEIQRIDIKGKDSLFTFKLKLKFGKLKLF